MACGIQKSNFDVSRGIDFITKTYPPELKDLVLYLLSQPSPTKSIGQVVVMVAPMLFLDYNAALMYATIRNNFVGNQIF
jgi:PAB-dependent poly(A)-specific ribonuclease subunit 3